MVTYQVTADPVVPGVTGLRYFATNTDRVLYRGRGEFTNNMPETGAPGHGREVTVRHTADSSEPLDPSGRRAVQLEIFAMSPLSRTLLLAFAALGLAASSASSYVHYRLLTDPGYSSFCDVNSTVSCTQAYLSPYGSFWGVPVALAGVFFFVLVLLLAGAGGRAASRSRRSRFRPTSSRCRRVGLAFVLYLGWASYVQLKTFCMLCAVTYVAVIAHVHHFRRSHDCSP